MSVDMKETYKGFLIEVTDNGTFVAWRTEVKENFVTEGSSTYKTEQVAEATTLESLKKKVDTLSKQRLGMDVWVGTYSGWSKGRVTSIKQDESRYSSRRSYSARVGFEGRDWSQHDVISLVKDTPENVVTIAAINGMKEEKEQLEKKIRAFEEKLERHKAEDFLGGPVKEE